jgi:hypothetical protein
MQFLTRNKMLGFLLLGVLLLGPSPSARADFKVRYSTNGGGSYTTVADNGSGDLAGALGSIQVNIVGVGTVTVNSSATESNDATVTLLDLGVNGSGIKGAIDLVVQATISDLTTAPPPLTLSYNFTGSVSLNATGATDTQQTWVDQANGLFGTGNIVADTTALNVPASGTTPGFTANSLYSLTTSIHVKTTGSTHQNTDKYSISQDSNNEIDPSPVPEPATLLLALLGGPVLGLGAWMRRRRISTSA